MNEKSILEQALLQVQTLEEAIKQNAKGILASTMKQELNDLLKESMEEDDVVVNEQPNPEDEEDMSTDVENDELNDEDPTKGIDDEEIEDEDEDAEIEDEDEDEDAEIEDEDEDEDEGFGDQGFGDEGFGDDEEDEVMDMTNAPDEEVLKVFKAMKPEDGVVVKKDGNQLDIDLGDDEYIIKLDGESNESNESEMFEGEEWGDDEITEPTEENMYEIELDGEEDVIKMDATEAARTKSNPHGNKGGMNRSGLPSKKKYKAGSGVVGINEEVTKLKKQNSEYKKALVLFKDKLNEVAVFNANLAYATRLFTEHSTTKKEKMNILKRFDSVSTMNESKGLYNTINAELVNKKPITESVIEKISSTPTTSSAKVLSESKAYENPQFKRMKELMSKIK